MKKTLIKGVILVAVFILSVIGFAHVSNQTNEDMTREMSAASLPLLSLYYEGTELNQLRAYVNDMDERFMRDTITPVAEDHIIPVQITELDDKISQFSYQIRNLDGTELLADAQNVAFTQEDHTARAEIEVQSIIDAGKEYALVISLNTGSRTCHFYTRILLPVDSYVKECLEFATGFHEKALDKAGYESLVTWLEPDASGDNSTLQKVNIHSSLKQIGYAEFDPVELVAPIPRIVEINNSYNVILLDYILSRKGENGETELYNTEEYFRIRHTDERDYLLNYERTMDQVYEGEDAQFYSSLIQLGVRGEPVDFAANADTSAVAFVQEGDLWSLNLTSGRLYRVYSFRGFEGVETRENYGGHEISIVNIAEDGSLNFVVYGYMNRGEHEGACGISICHFDSTTNTVEEEAFLPLNRSFEVLQSDMGGVFYENESRVCTFLLGGTIYRLDLTDRIISTQLTGLSEKAFAVPASNRYLAYQSDGSFYTSEKMEILDLENGGSTTVTADPGEFIMPLGFMQEDLIYGVARSSDIYTDAAGIITFPMYKVCIMSTGGDHELLKEYRKDGAFVTDLSVNGYTIYLDRVAWNGAGYTPIEQDTIMNREGDEMEKVTLHSTVTVVKQTELQIDMGTDLKTTRPKILTPKEIVSEDDRTVQLPGAEQYKQYYVYAAGKVLMSTDVFKDAVDTADAAMGVVVNGKLDYLWMRARALSKTPIRINPEATVEGGNSISLAVRGMLATKDISIDVESLLNNGQTPKQILESSLRDSVFLDLSGCDVTETLYYISNGTPVFAMSGPNSAVMLVGYDGSSVTMYDPVTTEYHAMTMENAVTYFHEAGNIFFTYID